MIKEMICINCPMGCHLSVDDSNKDNILVSGNLCPRGKIYAINEVTAPKRIVTSSVKIMGGKLPMVSVKTEFAIPKELIFKSLDLLKNITLNAPVKIGDIVVKNIFDTGVDFVVTKNIDRI